MIVMPAIGNVAITKENMISAHRDRIVDRDGHTSYAIHDVRPPFPSTVHIYTVPIASKATRVREYEYNMARVRVPRVRVQVSSLIKKCEYYHASTRVELLASTREYNI